MLKFIVIAALSWLVGLFGWAQVIGSLQNIKARRALIFTLILWVILLGIAAYVAIVPFKSAWALLVGYGISLIQMLGAGKIQ